MKKILDWLKHWFEHYGLVKILAAFVVLIIAVAIGRNFQQAEPICEWIAIISGCYLLLTVAIFTVAGIVNAIKDIFKKNENKNKKG
jgi:membrane-bound metal-dependent hydrolase YbcI (DUF457 family)